MAKQRPHPLELAQELSNLSREVIPHDARILRLSASVIRDLWTLAHEQEQVAAGKIPDVTKGLYEVLRFSETQSFDDKTYDRDQMKFARGH